LSRALRLVVGFGLLALAFWLSNPAEVLRAGASANPWWLVAAVLLVIPDRALMAYRWVVLLRAVDRAHHVPLSAILRVFFVSTFVGTFLPSIGGDAARAYGLSRQSARGPREAPEGSSAERDSRARASGGGAPRALDDADRERAADEFRPVSLSDAAASVVMDRVLGAWSLLLFAFGGLTFSGVARHDAGVLSALVITTAACAGAAAVLYSDAAARWSGRLIGWLPFASVRRASERLFEGIRRYGRHHGVVANVAIGSLIVQALRILQAYCLGRGLGIDAPLALYFALIPWTLLVMLVPISVNGLGTSQVAFVYLFGLVGVPHAQSFALSILCVALGAVGNLPGGFIYAFGAGETVRARQA
jgi:uncharacterized membrane protein YbhN (UPF0104 family)